MTATLTRVGLCASLLRLAQERRHKLILWAIIRSVISFLIAIVGILTQVSPIRGLWEAHINFDVKVHVRSGSYLQKFMFVFSGMSIGEDVATAIMPAIILWNLQKRPSERIQLIVLLGLGASAAIAISIRAYFLTTEPYRHYGRPPIFICTIFELGIAIVAGSLAPLKKAAVECWHILTRRKWQKLRTHCQQPEQIQLSPRDAKILSMASEQPVSGEQWV